MTEIVRLFIFAVFFCFEMSVDSSPPCVLSDDKRSANFGENFSQDVDNVDI